MASRASHSLFVLLICAGALIAFLCSREQVIQERKAMGIEGDVPNRPWGIISIKAQVLHGRHTFLPVCLWPFVAVWESGASCCITLTARVLHLIGVRLHQDEEYETPMQPITMLRNALGKEEGGSGVPLER